MKGKCLAVIALVLGLLSVILWVIFIVACVYLGFFQGDRGFKILSLVGSFMFIVLVLVTVKGFKHVEHEEGKTP